MSRQDPIDRAVILAGGGGTRLWPWTGPGRPKPLLPLAGGGRTLLKGTLDRLAGLLEPRHIAIQASGELAELLRAAEPGVAVHSEPSPRDTAPAVALAMRRLLDDQPGAVVAILPADQRIGDERAFAAALAQAGQLARRGELVLLAVPPKTASVRFGYLECAPGSENGDPPGLLEVLRFVEKPDAGRAAAYVAGARHFWNAGIFVWRADRFQIELRRHAPAVADAVERTHAGERAAWVEAPRTSIDYALLEKTERLKAVRLDADWDDVGSWEAVVRLAEECVDAGLLTRIEPEGGGPGGSLVLAVAGHGPPRPPRLPGRTPLLVVYGPGGVLVTPRA